MARPAIVIGVGGTGQWITTFLKKDLLETNRGELPENVRILCFDTAPLMTKEVVEELKSRGERAREVKVGAVTLDEGKEFIQLTGNVKERTEEVARGEHPHIGSWYRASYWLYTLMPSLFNLSEGAGRIRQMGRMAVFHDLENPRLSKIWGALGQAFREIKRDVTEKRQLEVIITGSFCGGTGAGMFIDMALLVHAAAAREVRKNYIVRGFFVLPPAFPGYDNEMRVRAFSAWRELDRFMILSPKWGLRQMAYHATESELRLELNRRAFDVCYLFNPNRSQNPLIGEPEEGVFPSVADAISAILDTKAGQKFTEWATANLNQIYVNNPGIPLHSSLGTYTLKVPVYYVQEECSQSLALDLLDIWLAPVKKNGKVVELAPDRNPDAGLGKLGREEVLPFLRCASISRGEETVMNSPFVRRIAWVLGQDGPTNATLIEAHARGSLGHPKGPIGEWLAAVTELGESAEAKQLRADIDEALRIKVRDVAPDSHRHKDHPVEALRRFKEKIPPFITEYYGTQLADGTIVPGKFGEALKRCGDFHLKRFRDLLRLWTLNTLMKDVDDPRQSLAGKLGYALDFFEGLVKAFDDFLTFMHKVEKERERLNLIQGVEDRKLRAKRAMEQNAARKFLFFFTHPAAYRTQEKYLNLEQEYINLLKDQHLHKAVKETAEAMRTLVVEARNELERWAQDLTLGDAPRGVKGLYNEIADELNSIRATFEADIELKKVQKLFGVKRYKRDEEIIEKALRRISWDVKADETGFRLRCLLKFTEKEMLPDGTEREVEKEVDLGHNAEARRKLLELTRSYYRLLPEEESIAKKLYVEYEGDGEALARALVGQGEPMYRSRGKAPAKAVSAYIRVRHMEDPQAREICRGAVESLRALYPGELKREAKTALVESDDRHKLTVVRSDDCIESIDFETWEECRRAYVKQIAEARKKITEEQRLELARANHCYPAEVNAVEYEFKIARMLRSPEGHYVLHPKVVMCLEDKTKVEQFFLAMAYGLILRERDPQTGEFLYQLRLPGEEPVYLTRPGGDIFDALGTYVFTGRDARGLTLWVRYEKVKQAIGGKREELGAEGILKKMKEEMENGVVDYLRKEVDKRREGVEEELKKYIGRDYEDLSYLARVIYEGEIEKYQ